jgi:hypothetical protein
MCTFITSWVYGSIDRIKLKAILRENGFDLDEYPDSPLKQKVGASIYFRPTKTQCDCGTVFGRQNQKGSSEAPIEVQVQRLKRKGWGEAKIRKWLEELERAKKKTAREKPRNDTATSQEWLKLFNQILRNHGIKSFGLLFHHYHGNQTVEDFEIGEKVVLNLKDLTEEELGALISEIPYEISDSLASRDVRKKRSRD